MVYLPLWKMMEFVNGKDDIPSHIWNGKLKKVPNHQPGQIYSKKKHCTKIGAATALHCPYVCHWNHWERENQTRNPGDFPSSSSQILSKRFTAWLRTSTWWLPPFTHRKKKQKIGWWKVASKCLQRGGFNRKKVVHLTVKLGIWSKKLVELNWKQGTGNQHKLGPLRLVLVVLIPLLAKKMDGGHVRLKSLPAFKSSKFLQDVNSQQLPAGIFGLMISKRPPTPRHSVVAFDGRCCPVQNSHG